MPHQNQSDPVPSSALADGGIIGGFDYNPFVSGFITNHVKNSIKGSTKTKGYVVKKVKTPDMIPPSASRKKLWELVSISFLSERGKLATSNWSAEKMTACL